MKHGTHEENRRHAASVVNQPERWWRWKNNRRVYTTVELTADKEASAKRKRRHHFRAHRNAIKHIPHMKMRQPLMRELVHAAQERACKRREARAARAARGAQ